MYPVFTRNIILLLLCLTALGSFAQSSKKQTMARYSQLAALPVDSLKTTNYSALARELSIEDFMSYYIENGKEKMSKKYGHEFIDSLYSNAAYTFYVRRTTNYPIDFIKVKTSDFSNIAMAAIDGKLIRQQFIDEIVPAADKESVKKKSTNCSMGSEYGDFTYLYNRSTRLVEVQYKWKVTCGFIKVINKNYTAFYNIEVRRFSSERKGNN